MVNEVLQKAIDDNLLEIFENTPLDEILHELYANGVLSEGEVDILRKVSRKVWQISEFIKILRTKADKDYEKFYKALIQHHDPAAISLGKKLRTYCNADEAGIYFAHTLIRAF